jgi:hypothetical protein
MIGRRSADIARPHYLPESHDQAFPQPPEGLQPNYLLLNSQTPRIVQFARFCRHELNFLLDAKHRGNLRLNSGCLLSEK